MKATEIPLVGHCHQRAIVEVGLVLCEFNDLCVIFDSTYRAPFLIENSKDIPDPTCPEDLWAHPGLLQAKPCCERLVSVWLLAWMKMHFQKQTTLEMTMGPARTTPLEHPKVLENEVISEKEAILEQVMPLELKCHALSMLLSEPEDFPAEFVETGQPNLPADISVRLGALEPG